MGKGKRPQNKISLSPQASPATEEASAVSALAGWHGDLTQQELEVEQRRVEERARKAQAAKERETQERRRHEAAAKEQERQERQQRRKAAQEDQALQREVERARKEGVLEAVEHVDGLWYVELQPSVWKVVDCTYFCPHCEASLDPHTLSSHLNGGNHRRKMSWLQDDLRGGAAPTCFPCHGGGGIAPAPGRAGGDALAGEPPLQSWQQVDEDGNRRCLACNKWCDGVHEQTQEHKRRVANYVDGGAVYAHGGCPAPAQPWLVWAQGEAWGEERSLKCLLCDKWVQDFGDADTTGYRGHHGELGEGNQKDHRKKMENLEAYKRDTMYWSQLLAERERWHPSQAASPTSPPSVPAGWAAVWSEEYLAFYYHHEATLAAQWDPPPLPAVAAPSSSPDPGLRSVQRRWGSPVVVASFSGSEFPPPSSSPDRNLLPPPEVLEFEC